MFGVQLAGTDPTEMGWAAALAEARGADFVDVNLGCPIDHFTSKGMGAALARQPKRVARIVGAMVKGVSRAPVTVKIRLGWNERDRNFLEVARAAVEAGAQAVFVHGRTRDARYRLAADWEAVGEVVAAVPVPVVGNGDLLWPHEIAAARQRAGCAGVMVGRGALIKPWLFREVTEGPSDLGAEQRLAVYRRYVELSREHWGEDGHATGRIREFLVWHLNFWCRYAPPRADGSFPALQQREPSAWARSPLEAVLARTDVAAHEWIADRLLSGEAIDPADAPAATLEHEDDPEVVTG
ncbi:MAG: tRNA-dihydrouridine synthase family protein [Vicinamibacterales bacterium]|nr:tRNA-dihydrouridine synthase family protein [Vicinamibacterales bacterium]